MRALPILLLCFLTLYSPVELTRLIGWHGVEFGEEWELALIWGAYSIFILVLTKVVRD